MLHWLQRKFSEDLFKTVLIVSCILHIFIFSFIFFSRSGWSGLALEVSSLNTHEAIIKILPLGAVRPQKRGKKGGIKSADGKKQKKSQKKIENKPKTAIHELIDQKSTSVTSKKKNKKKAADDAMKNKNDSTKKKLIDEKNSEDSSEPVPDVKKEEKIIELIKEQEEKSHSVHDDVDNKTAIDPHAPFAQDGVIYVTQKEFDALQSQMDIQRAIQEVWAPPVGMPDDIVSQVRLDIGWKGEIVSVEYIKPTGIVVYDMAVERAIESIEFPKQMWGKRIVIAFKP